MITGMMADRMVTNAAMVAAGYVSNMLVVDRMVADSNPQSSGMNEGHAQHWSWLSAAETARAGSLGGGSAKKTGVVLRNVITARVA